MTYNKQTKQKAGVVVYWKDDKDETEFFVITSRKFPGTWVFPAGTVEQGETLRQAAARECTEESGYVVEVGREIMSLEVGDNDKSSHFTFYMARVIRETDEYEKDRERKWVPENELMHTITHVFKPIAEEALTING